MTQAVKHIVTLEKDPKTGDLILPFPTGLLEEMGWEIGDTLNFEDAKDGSFIITKVK